MMQGLKQVSKVLVGVAGLLLFAAAVNSYALATDPVAGLVYDIPVLAMDLDAAIGAAIAGPVLRVKAKDTLDVDATDEFILAFGPLFDEDDNEILAEDEFMLFPIDLDAITIIGLYQQKGAEIVLGNIDWGLLLDGVLGNLGAVNLAKKSAKTTTVINNLIDGITITIAQDNKIGTKKGVMTNAIAIAIKVKVAGTINIDNVAVIKIKGELGIKGKGFLD